MFIKKFIKIFFIFLITCYSLAAQNDESARLCFLAQEYSKSFLNDAEAEKSLERILSVIGLNKNFILKSCNDINNALAITYKSERYILYDKEFMQLITNNTNKWSNLFILAHEVGHHVNGHTRDFALIDSDFNEESLFDKRQDELEADQFAGFILAKLGASLDETTKAIELISSNSDDTFSTHPNKAKRLNAIRLGYFKANPQDLKISPDKVQLLEPSSKTFGSWFNEFEVINPDHPFDRKEIEYSYTFGVEIPPNPKNTLRPKILIKKGSNEAVFSGLSSVTFSPLNWNTVKINGLCNISEKYCRSWIEKIKNYKPFMDFIKNYVETSNRFVVLSSPSVQIKFDYQINTDANYVNNLIPLSTTSGLKNAFGLYFEYLYEDDINIYLKRLDNNSYEINSNNFKKSLWGDFKNDLLKRQKFYFRIVADDLKLGKTIIFFPEQNEFEKNFLLSAIESYIIDKKNEGVLNDDGGVSDGKLDTQYKIEDEIEENFPFLKVEDFRKYYINKRGKTTLISGSGGPPRVSLRLGNHVIRGMRFGGNGKKWFNFDVLLESKITSSHKNYYEFTLNGSSKALDFIE